MSNAIFLPFGHKPSTTIHLLPGLLTSHTIATGYYARVRVCITVTTSLSASMYNTTIGGVEMVTSSDSQNITGDFWVEAGDAVTLTVDADYTPGSSTTSSGVGATVANKQTAYARIAGNTVAQADAYVFSNLPAITSNTWTYEIIGYGVGSVWIEEYPIQT